MITTTEEGRSVEEVTAGITTSPDGHITGRNDGPFARVGAVVGGRNTYEAAAAWGGHNPFGVPFFIVTHRPEDAPADAGFTFVNGLDEAIAQARDAAGGKDVFATHSAYRVVR